MPEHQKDIGVVFIQRLKELGSILGYYTQSEVPVDDSKQQSPAVDLAWFKEENQKFPLFIFEVESAATNGMTYNPMKVFSKKNEAFLKPLFFFQVVLKGGQNSSRIEDLKESYGTYNYRIYRVLSSESQNFLFDILEQHRRISQNLDIVSLFIHLIKTKWVKIKLEALANHIQVLEFEKYSGLALSSYVLLASTYEKVMPIVSNYLTKIHSDYYSNIDKVSYKNYIGQTWCFPIHLGVIYASTDDLFLKERCVKQLKYWQEKNSYLTMIGPHFGLSMDYDEFITWGSGGLFGILSSLFSDNYAMRLYFTKQLIQIIKKTRLEFKTPNLLWLCHIIPPVANSKKIFNFISKSINEVGHFSIEEFWNPPFLCQKDYSNRICSDKNSFPLFNEFVAMITSKNQLSKMDSLQLSCNILTTECYDDKLSKFIIASIRNVF